MVGYLNGVNIVVSFFFYYKDVLKGVILYYLMVLICGIKLFDMMGFFVFIGVGKYDFFCMKEELEEFYCYLCDSGVLVFVYWEDGGY